MSADPVKKLATLTRKLKAQHAPVTAPTVLPEPPDEFGVLVHELVYSMLLWEASTTQARNALRRIRESVVDYNELRVCVADEMAHIIGDKYPLALERAMRLRTTLNDVYQRHHAITLNHLGEAGKREARQYLDHLAGCPPFAAARVCLLHGLGHAFPLDERLRDLLVKEDVVADSATVEQATHWLEHHIKAEEALETHLLFQAWSDEHGHPPKRDKRPITIQTTPTVEARHDGKQDKAKAPAKARTKPEPAAKKTKSKPRSGS